MSANNIAAHLLKYFAQLRKLAFGDVLHRLTCIACGHTAEDSVVPVQNSLQLYNALCEKKIYSELHVFPHGEHGLGMAPDRNDIGQWPELLRVWLTNLGF